MAREPGWVLVVVDDAVRRMALFRLVEWAGHRATVADTGRAGLTMLHREPFHVVLLDVSIAERDGQDFLRQGTVSPHSAVCPCSWSPRRGHWTPSGRGSRWEPTDSSPSPSCPSWSGRGSRQCCTQSRSGAV